MYILGLFLFFFLINFASAGCSNNQSQIIMQLSSQTNAHGALWNQSYSINLCYNDLFSVSYTGTGSNSHNDCTNHNNGLLLRLYSENNSHAAFDDSAYTIPVCYKGLEKCKLGGCTEAELADGKCGTIAYISNATNAHISSGLVYYPTTSIYKPITCICTQPGCTKKPIVVVSRCSNYDESDCSSDPAGVAQSSCAGYKANCTWNNATSKCEAKCVDYSDPSNPNSCARTCTKTGSDATECSAGSQIVSTIATTSYSKLGCSANNFISVFDCKSDSQTVPCGTIEEVSLPFFGAWQFIISLVSVAFIYILIERKRLL